MNGMWGGGWHDGQAVKHNLFKLKQLMQAPRRLEKSSQAKKWNILPSCGHQWIINYILNPFDIIVSSLDVLEAKINPTYEIWATISMVRTLFSFYNWLKLH